ncbi:MAG: trxA [Oscillospiraceae bacterium]|jgi:thioredoxin 1|nr:trxA [Oscillospiraceae bacterium]
MSVITITKQHFEDEIVHSNKTVLMDFWAPWCIPCKAISPIIDEIADEADENVLVGKINVDEQTELADQFDVMSIPTLVILKNGKVHSKAVGVKPKESILSMLEE